MLFKLLVCLTFCVSWASADHSNAHSGFYANSDRITELTPSNLNQTLLCQGLCDVAHLVLFYHNNSIATEFASTYFDMARDTVAWQKFVKLAAVNCDNQENNEICRLYGYSGQRPIRLPMLKYFQRRAKVENILGEIKIANEALNVYFKPHTNLEQLVEKLNNDYWQNAYNDWPNFLVLGDFHKNSDEIWHSPTDRCDRRFLAVLVESTNSTHGLNKFIDVHYGVEKAIPVRRILKSHYLANLFKNSLHFPSTVFVERPKTDSYECTQSNELTESLDYYAVLRKIGVAPTDGEVVREHDGKNVVDYYILKK